MWGVAGIGWLVIIAYLSIVLVMGLGTFRRVKSASGFFIGDRRYGKLTMILNSFGGRTVDLLCVSDHAGMRRT